MTSGGAMGGEADILWVDVRARTDENSFREMEAQAEASGERAGEGTGEGLKGKVGAALAGLPGIALAAGVAVGAALAAGLKSAVDIAAQVNQGQLDMQASLGVTAQEAEELGKVAKKVFGNNWGEDLKAAQDAVANVRREIKGLSDGDLQTVTEGSIAIAERFEEDQSKVAASVQALMKATGQSAQESLDFISAGFQKGLNSSGDFLDTLQEYGPQFEKAKITGGALFSLLETGAAKGALGTDKVADSFKEFGLTVIDVSDDSKAVYRELGLDQEKLAAQINSGAVTQAQAYQMVTEKLRGIKGAADQTRIASAIFGGAGEDFGPGLTQLDLTKTKLDDLKGSTDTVLNASNTLGAVFVTAGRQVQLALEPAGQELLKLANEAMPYVSAAIERLQPIVVAAVRYLVDGFRQARQSVEPLTPVVQGLGSLFQSVFGLIKTLWEGVLLPVVTALAPAFQIAFGMTGNIVTTVLGVITGVINAVSALLRGDFTAAWAAISGIVTGAFEGVRKHVLEFLPQMKQFGVDLGLQIINGLQSGMDGLQAMLLSAIAKALTTLGDKLPAILKPLAGQLAQAAQEAADRNAGDAAARRPYSGIGPNIGGTAADPNAPVIVTGKDLATLLGLGGRTVLNAFGVSGKDYHHDGAVRDDAVHNGIDYGAPRGSSVLAPFSGLVTLRQDTTNGKIFDLTDAEGKRLTGIHLDSFNKEIQTALAAGARSVFVEAGTKLGGVGNTGTTAGKTPHLHLMAYLPDGSVVDATTVKFVSLKDAAAAQAGVTAQPKVGTPDNAKPTAAIVPLPTPEEQKAYTLNLADWNKYSREALAIAHQIKEADVSTDAGFTLRVRARAAAFQEEGDAQSGALAFAQERLNRAKEVAKVETETDLQRDQRTRREQLAQEALQSQIRDAGEKRLNQIIKIGVTSTNSLEKINLAEAELERRGKLSADAARAAGVAREKAAKDAEAAEEKAEVKAAARLKEQAQLRARVADEGRKLTESAAAQVLTRTQALNREELEVFKGTGVQRAALVKRQAEDEAAARLAVARVARDNELRNSANADYNNTDPNRAERDRQTRERFNQAEREAASTRAAAGRVVTQAIQQEQSAVAGLIGKYNEARVALEARAKSGPLTADDLAAYARQLGGYWEEAGRAGVKAQPQIEAAHAAAKAFGQTATNIGQSVAGIAKARQDADAAYQSARKFNLETVGNRTDDGLITLYSEASAQRDTELMAKVAEEIGTRGEALNARLNDSLALASQTRIDLLRDEALAAEDVAPDFAAIRIELERQGRPLADLIVLAQDYAKRTDVDTTAAQNFLKTLNGIEVQAKRTTQALDDTSEARRTAEPNVLGVSKARGTATPALGVSQARGALSTDQVNFQEEVYRAGRVDAYRKSLADLTVTQLEEAQAAALAAGQQERHALITEVLTGRVNTAATAHQAWVMNLDRIGEGEWLAGLKKLSDAELQVALDAARANENVAEFNALLAEIKDREINVTLKVAGVDTGLKALDVYKSAISGVATVISGVFENLVAGTETGVNSILKSMGLMALGIVKQVALSIVALEAQAIATAIVKGAFGDLLGLGLALAAAAAVAGIVAGLESRIQGGGVGQAASVTPVRGDTSSTPTAASNSNITIPTAQVTVMAAPEWIGTFGAHVGRFGEHVDRFGRQGVRVLLETESGGGSLAYDLTTGGG